MWIDRLHDKNDKVSRPKIRQCFVAIFHYREKRVKMSTLLPQRRLFSPFLDYSLNSYSFPPFFQWRRVNKILAFTLFPKKGELIFGRDGYPYFMNENVLIRIF